MNFVFTLIATLFGFWVGKIYSRTEQRLHENELLDEIRKLCNELLKIKDKGTIVITNLSVAKGKGENKVVVTTLPKETNNEKN